MKRHACPKCQSTTGLWQNVMMSGYIYVDEYLNQKGSPEDDGAYFDEQDTFGCCCGWGGPERQLIVLGVDDEALPEIHPLQMSLGEAAQRKGVV